VALTDERPRDLERLATEQVREDLANLDRLGPEDLVSLMTADARRAPEAVIAAAPQIAQAVEGIARRLERGGRLVYVGAGTAGRLGVLDAAETGPTFDVDDGQVIAILAGGPDAIVRPSEGAEDVRDGAVPELQRLALRPEDAVVGITASGRTPYVLGALEWARGIGALTVSVACNAGAEVSPHADVPIELDVGSEVIAGSTRMNAGTAQKITLNVISTAVMVLLGKTYGNRMVHMRATNAKLRDRALRMVSEVTGADPAAAAAALEASGGETKVAIAMIARGVDAVTAREILEAAHGRLRDALDGRPEVEAD
jgi:N-acetylmuramic acid 6-phosphate etherase